MEKHIIVDPEFESLIQPLTETETTQLHSSLNSDGCRDALIVWEGENILLDGHNRYRHCTKNGIPFDVREVQMADRETAHNFIILNQLGRRNLNPKAKSLLQGKLYNGRKKSKGGDRKSKCQSDTLKDASEAVAKETGSSPATVKRDAKFAESVNKLGIEKDVMSGKEKRSKKEIIDTANGPRKRRKKDTFEESERFADIAIFNIGRINLGEKSARENLIRVRDKVDALISEISNEKK